MILSKKHRFLFIKGRKVAGTSVEMALSKLCGEDDIITPITAIDEQQRVMAGSGAQNYSADRTAEIAYLDSLRTAIASELENITPAPASIYYNVMPLRDIVRLQGPYVLDFRIACVERSPYAKIISWANGHLASAAYSAGGLMIAEEDDVRGLVDRSVADGEAAIVKNIELYRAPDGTLPVHVIKHEDLQAEFAAFACRLGLDPPMLPHAKRGLIANDLDPHNWFTRGQLDIINEMFAEEFDAFGYQRL